MKGLDLSVGVDDDNNITSIGSSKGSVRFGMGCGASIGIELCETTVIQCRGQK